MAKDGGIFQDVFNSVKNTDPNKPDSTGDDLYFQGWDEVMKMHLTTGPMDETPNSMASRDVYGGPTSGEANPAGMKGKG